MFDIRRRVHSYHREDQRKKSSDHMNISQQYIPNSLRNPQPLLPHVKQNKEHLINYTFTMKLLQKKTYEQLSSKLLKIGQNTNIKQRMLANKLSIQQKIQDAAAQEFVTTILRNPLKPIVKGSVQLPLQNEYAYTMPESRQGCRVIKFQNNGILLGGYSHKEHIDINAISLFSGQWIRKQEFFGNACEKLRQKLKLNIQLPLGCGFSINEDDKIIYAFGGQRNVGNRRTSNTLTKIYFTLEQVQWEQYQIHMHPRRNHSATIIDHHLVIIGGLDDSDQRTIYYNDFYAINLNNNELKQFWPKFYLLDKNNKSNENPFKHGIAYHSAVAVGNSQYQVKPDYTQILKSDEQQLDLDSKSGIYIFGGKNSENLIYDQVYLLQTDQSLANLIEIDTKGVSPQPRRSSSLDYDENTCSLILFGGTDDQICFADLYLLFIRNYTWAKVKLSGYLAFEARFDHCSIFHEGKLLIFGGLNENGYLLFNPIQISIRFKQIQKYI